MCLQCQNNYSRRSNYGRHTLDHAHNVEQGLPENTCVGIVEQGKKCGTDTLFEMRNKKVDENTHGVPHKTVCCCDEIFYATRTHVAPLTPENVADISGFRTFVIDKAIELSFIQTVVDSDRYIVYSTHHFTATAQPFPLFDCDCG